MSLPYVKLVVPTPLLAHKNGQIPPSMLAKISTGGLMYAPVATHFNAMYAKAGEAGFRLKNIGDYRSFDAQLKMFLDRYATTDEGRNPQVTRQYEGKTWYLKKGKAPSAAPDPTGKKGSNHGWGLAIDLAYDKNGKTEAMGGACFEWMCANAPSFGFYLQTGDPNSKEFEAWHWQYALGDASPDGSVATPPSSNPANPPALVFSYPGTPIKKGSEGDAVKLVQAIVGAEPIDGKFGSGTEAKVKAWQNANGLGSDGVIGPVTWKKMFG